MLISGLDLGIGDRGGGDEDGVEVIALYALAFVWYNVRTAYAVLYLFSFGGLDELSRDISLKFRRMLSWVLSGRAGVKYQSYL